MAAIGTVTPGVRTTADRWFAVADVDQPADAVVLTVAVVAAVLAAWWVANVVTWIGALRTGVDISRFTLPGTRRLAQLVLAASLMSSCVADGQEGPAMVLVEPDGATGVGSGNHETSVEPTSTASPEPSAPDPVLTDPVLTDPVLPDLPITTVTAPSTTGPSVPDGPATTAGSVQLEDSSSIDDDAAHDGPTEVTTIPDHQVVVVAGDNLWSLSAEALQRHGLDAPDNSTIASYWRIVVAGNQVRSGNPDLIVPGETIVLPAHTIGP